MQYFALIDSIYLPAAGRLSNLPAENNGSSFLNWMYNAIEDRHLETIDDWMTHQRSLIEADQKYIEYCCKMTV